jgi:hypothetical protein
MEGARWALLAQLIWLAAGWDAISPSSEIIEFVVVKGAGGPVGMAVTEHDQDIYVQVLAPAGSAQAAGLLKGDQVMIGDAHCVHAKSKRRCSATLPRSSDHARQRARRCRALRARPARLRQ